MIKKNTFNAVFTFLTLYSIAMAFLESAVVVYLREIYYPEGFDFPLAAMSDRIMLTEIVREAATIVMLIMVAYMADLKPVRRFAWFLYAFALWDIFYYVFLKLLLNWPDSLMTWDILFLIPVVWTGPVVAPIISSFTMIALAWLLLTNSHLIQKLHLKRMIILVLAGAFLVFISYIYDFMAYVIRNDAVTAIFNTARERELIHLYMPVYFNWWLFVIGELLMLTGMFIFYVESGSLRKDQPVA